MNIKPRKILTLEDDEARIRLLEDLEEIKNLKRLHGFYANVFADDIGKIDEFAALFTDDAEYDVGLGFAVGPKAIAEQMRSRRASPEYRERIIIAMHYYLTPYIEVNGDHATGKWSGLLPTILKGNPRPVWLGNMYDETYRRTPDGWRFSSMKTSKAFEPPEFFQAYEKFTAGIYGANSGNT